MIISQGKFIVLTLIAYIVLAFFAGFDTPHKEPEVKSSIPLEQPLSPPLSSVSAAPEDPIYDEREIECLALNSYFEARNQSLAGQIAVAQVVLNRVKSPKFPDTICEVIQQGPTYENWKGNVLPVRHQCHFSWWCDGKSDIPEDNVTYRDILNVTIEIIVTQPIDITEGSLYYHADYVNPVWANSFIKTVVIDNHIFYKNIL